VTATNAAAHVGVASDLIRADLSFHTVVGNTSDGQRIRIFRLPFDIGAGGSVVVSAYVAGPVFVVVTPLRITSDDPAKRVELIDFVSSRLLLGRIVPDTPTHADADRIVWLEAACPVPVDGEPLAAGVAREMIGAIANGVDVILSKCSYVEAAQIERLRIPTVEHVPSGSMRAAERTSSG
jgi:hypothetical protein